MDNLECCSTSKEAEVIPTLTQDERVVYHRWPSMHRNQKASMSGRRQIHRSDENQKGIVKALRDIGVTVYIIEEPVDLLCGFRGRTVALEVKNPKRGWKLKPSQEKFFREFNGEAYIVEDEGQALRAMLKK